MISIGINTTGKNTGQNYGLVTLNGLTLPNDCIFSPEFEKTIAKSQIVDGVEVFQRISRKSTSVTFDFTLRQEITTEGTFLQANKDEYVFPIDKLIELYTETFKPDKVLTVNNIVLNRLGIKLLIVEKFRPTLIRGSVSIPCVLTCYEDYYSNQDKGNTLII